ncbi:hypothetical protein BRADI_5g01189v3 [Brachypodium distachyon]|uniref:Uncharacterized protein n=1 Tax=Brachypodium distachyon TaxID=15368 RepID=A0A0Q3E1E5_BRADI|nr:hypothetical protein BRADI_5g01189v3 [Brachypodium distachyon]
MVSLSTWFRYAAHKFEYSISLSWKKYNVGQINSTELTDAIWKSFFQGKLTFAHWTKDEGFPPLPQTTSFKLGGGGRAGWVDRGRRRSAVRREECGGVLREVRRGRRRGLGGGGGPGWLDGSGMLLGGRNAAAAQAGWSTAAACWRRERGAATRTESRAPVRREGAEGSCALCLCDEEAASLCV